MDEFLKGREKNKFVQLIGCTIYLQPNDCNKGMRRDVFQAIADPTRREIITLIANEKLTPHSVANSFNVSRQAISKHIKILTECGIVVINMQGKERYCYIKPEKLDEVNNWVLKFKQTMEQRFDRMDQLLMKMYAN